MASDRTTRTLDPKLISIIYGAHIITGFADGDFVSVTTEDNFVARTGADGSEDRVNANKTGADVELTLMGTSLSNDALTTYFETDKAGNAGKKPLFIKDLNGTMIVHSEQAYIKKRADKTVGDSPGTVVWSIRAPQATYIPGSNL